MERRKRLLTTAVKAATKRATNTLAGTTEKLPNVVQNVKKNRDRREYNLRYYAEHAEEIKAKKRAYYAAHPGLSAQNSQYYRAKQKLLTAEAREGGPVA